MPSDDVSKKTSTARTRYHAFVTYASLEQINRVIYDHLNSIVSYCYICHDNDATDIHYHLIIRTYDAWSISQIAKWFSFVKMESGQNTFNERVGDLSALEAYLTHSDAESVKQGKHRYDSSLIKDFGLLSASTRREAYDDTYEIVLAMQAGMRTRELVRRYGKKFLYHYSQYIAVRDAIEYEDRVQAVIARDALAKEEALQKLPPIPLDNISIEEILK